MNPTPEQIAELTRRLKHETWSGFQNLAEQASSAITEQATEIAALKAHLASASEGLVEAYNFQSSGTVPSIHDYGRWRRIEASIIKLLKD
jgi:hypothetical protein